MGLVCCFVASAGFMFGLGLIFAVPPGVEYSPAVVCEIGDLDESEGLYLTKTCANLTEVAVDTSCTWACGKGYDVAGGVAKRTCLANSTWSGNPLVCEKEADKPVCTVPEAPLGSKLDISESCKRKAQGVPAGTECLWVCERESIGGNMQRFCEEDGKWSGEPVMCHTEEPPTAPTTASSLTTTHVGEETRQTQQPPTETTQEDPPIAEEPDTTAVQETQVPRATNSDNGGDQGTSSTIVQEPQAPTIADSDNGGGQDTSSSAQSTNPLESSNANEQRQPHNESEPEHPQS